MSWFNYWGLIILTIVMIPNIVYALKVKSSWAYHNKALEAVEQIGRYGCFIFMVFNIPFTHLGFYFDYGQYVYLIVNGLLLTIYCVAWAVLFNKNNLPKKLILSIVPSTIFLFSGIMIASAPLIISALVFAPTHICISCKSIEQ